jgi:xylulokinase
LTGQFVTDRGDASGTGYWSPRENRYRIDLLSLVDEEVDWPELLPRVLGPWDVAGDLTAQSARELGLLRGIKVAPGTGDNMAGALGLGLRAGDVAVSIGTSGTVFATSDHPAQDPTGAVAGFADATGRFLPLVCTLNATLVTNAVARLLDVDFATLEKLALGAPAGSGGVTLVPYLAGERTPNRPEATGTLFGIRTDVSRELVARAAFEGVVCGLLEGLDALNVVGVPTTGQLLLIGGGAKSRAYREVLATLSNRSVVVPDETEIVAAGACVQAAIMESTSDVDAIVNSWSLGSGEIVEPGNGSLDAEGIRHRYASARG